MSITLAIALGLAGCDSAGGPAATTASASSWTPPSASSGAEPAGTPASASSGDETAGTPSPASDPSSEQAWALFLVDQLWDPTGDLDEVYADIGEDAGDRPDDSPEPLAWIGRALVELGAVAHDSVSEKLAADGAATDDLAAKLEAVIEAGGRAERAGKAAVACAADDEVFASEACRGAFDEANEAGDELYEALEPWAQELCLRC